jgi:Cu(I)/Ag(I) efflux system membrane fusion protein
MKKRNVLALALLILAGGILIFLSKAGHSQKGGETADRQAPPAREHQAHEAAKPQEDIQDAHKEEPAEAPPTVEIPVDKQQMIGLKTVEVSLRQLSKVIRTVGRIEFDERKLSTVNAKFEGWIEKLYIDYTGKQVRKGEPLAEVYSPELVATQQEFINAVKWSRQNSDGKKGEIQTMLSRDADTLVDAARQRLKFWDISDEQIKKIEESGKSVRTLTLYSPVNGYVVQKMAIQGMRVMPGEKLFDIADLSTIWVVADIYENELSMVKQGQKARITMSYLPGRDMNAVIDYVYPSLSADTRTAKVRFIVPNTGLQLKPQMFTNVEITIPVGRKLAVPSSAVLDTGTRQIVYVDKGDGYFEPREVRAGLRVEEMIEILDGVKQGEKIASSAIFLIDSEAQLKGVKPLSGGHKH